MNPASASSPWAGRIAASATSSSSASSSESPAASSGPPSRSRSSTAAAAFVSGLRHRVDLAALQRHGPAAGGAPAPEGVDPALRHGGAVDDGVREEAARRPQIPHERSRRRTEVGLDVGERRATGQPRRHQRRPGAVGDAVDDQVAAVARDREPRRRPRQPHPRELLGGTGGDRDDDRAGVQIAQQCPRGLGEVRQRRAPVDLDAQQPRRRRVGNPQVERVHRVDQRAVQVGANDHRTLPTARPSAPVAPRVNRGWISPTQL